MISVTTQTTKKNPLFLCIFLHSHKMSLSVDILQRFSMKIEWLFTSYTTNPLKIFIIIGIVVVVGVLMYLYEPYWMVRKVRGPPIVPLLGHIHLMAKYGPDVFSILANKYGPIFRFHLGRQPMIIVADPELFKEVGIKKFKDIPNRSIPSPISASPLHQKGLFFTRGTRWSTMRNTVVSMYQPSHLASLVPTMQSFIESATQNLESSSSSSKGSDIVFSDLSLRMATDVIGQAAFGVNFGLSKPQSVDVDVDVDHDHNQKNMLYNDEVSDFIKQHIYSTTQLKMDLSGSLSIILGLLVPILQEPVRQILKRIPGTMDWKVDRTNRKLSTRLDEIVLNRIILQEKIKLGADDHDHDSKDLLSLILETRPDSGSRNVVFTQDYISATVYEHLLAGSATTAFTLSSVVYLVSRHPNVENKLLAEIDGFGPHDDDQIPTSHDLQYKFPYLDQVIKEAMRFYFVSPLIARETAKQVEIGSYLLPKGTWVWLAPGVVAKDATHFPEPDKFNPERFDPDCEEERQRHPYAFIPFGIGPRACIGQKFSLQEIKLSLIHLYRKFVFRHSPNMECPLELEFGIVVNFKHGVKLRVINRI